MLRKMKMDYQFLKKGEKVRIDFIGSESCILSKKDCLSVCCVSVYNLHKMIRWGNKPNLETLKEGLLENTLKSVLGYSVDESGFDKKGAPNWLIALGYVGDVKNG